MNQQHEKTLGNMRIAICADANDLPVPGQKFTFGTVKSAQARGDFQVLAERSRRAMRVHLKDVDHGVAARESAIKLALS